MTDHNPESTFITEVFSLQSEAGRARWSHLYINSKQATPYSSLFFADEVTAAFGIKAEIWLVHDGSSDVAGILVFHQQKGPFNRVIVPAFTQYTSILLAPHASETQAPVQKLLSGLTSTFDDLRLHLHTSLTLAPPTSWQQTPLQTYGIDLEAYDPSRKSWSQSKQRTYKKHVSDFQFSEDFAALEACINLCAEGYAQSNRTFPASKIQLFKLINRLIPHQMIKVYALKPVDSNELSAGIVILHSRDTNQDTAYYWIAGSVRGPAMTVLLGHTFEQLKAEGFCYFDFVGANTPSIAEFKRRFGPELVPYSAITQTPNRLMAFLLNVKSRVR